MVPTFQVIGDPSVTVKNALAEEELVGVCQVAAVPEVAVKTCPLVGAVAVETSTVVVADFKAEEYPVVF